MSTRWDRTSFMPVRAFPDSRRVPSYRSFEGTLAPSYGTPDLLASLVLPQPACRSWSRSPWPQPPATDLGVKLRRRLAQGVTGRQQSVRLQTSDSQVRLIDEECESRRQARAPLLTARIMQASSASVGVYVHALVCMFGVGAFPSAPPTQSEGWPRIAVCSETLCGERELDAADVRSVTLDDRRRDGRGEYCLVHSYAFLCTPDGLTVDSSRVV